MTGGSTRTRPTSPSPRTDEVSGLGREDVRRVCGADRLSGSVECCEADTPLDDQRVMMRRNDMAESHAADRVGREPRFHANLHGHTVEIERATEWAVGTHHEVGRASTPARDGDVVAIWNLNRLAA